MKGASYTNPIDASTIATIGPIFTLMTSFIVQSRRATKGEMLGIIVAIVGVVAILVDRGRMLLGEVGEAYGNALVLCAVVAIAVNTVLITNTIPKFSGLLLEILSAMVGPTAPHKVLNIIQ